MLTVLTGTKSQLPHNVERELANYRYEVFIKALQWQLSAVDDLEFDKFDGPHTLYVIAKDADGLICGCARLLPTTEAYLLGEVFPGLLSGEPAPHTSDVWELSRFSTKVTGELSQLSRDEARKRFCVLFAAVVEAALEKGAVRLITFTAMGIERILRSIGLHVHRVGPPQWIDGRASLALWIELDDQTCSALQLPRVDRAILN